jgi:hypothetical protein
LAFAWKDLGNLRKVSHGVADVSAGIQTGVLLNTSSEGYRYSILFGMSLMMIMMMLMMINIIKAVYLLNELVIFSDIRSTHFTFSR